MRNRSDRPQLFLLFAGAVALTALSISKLPSPSEILTPPSTPFDRSPGKTAPDYRLFSEVASKLPVGSSVAAISEPRDAARETVLFREAIGLLPGCRLQPAAAWETPTHLEEKTRYWIVAGPRPSPPPGELILETPEGSLWRRSGL